MPAQGTRRPELSTEATTNAVVLVPDRPFADLAKVHERGELDPPGALPSDQVQQHRDRRREGPPKVQRIQEAHKLLWHGRLAREKTLRRFPTRIMAGTAMLRSVKLLASQKVSKKRVVQRLRRVQQSEIHSVLLTLLFKKSDLVLHDL